MHDKLTKEDIDKMQEEIDHRKLVVRPKALADLKEARAQGDLSENFEYYAAKRFKNQNESRIRYLENMIKTAVVIEDHSSPDEVGLGKRVTIRFEEDGSEESFKIVTSVRGNSLKGLITPESPLGHAVMGCHVGETTHVKLAGGGYDVMVTGIQDAGGEEDALRKF